MIKILNENSIDDLSDEKILKLYDNEVKRIEQYVDIVLNDVINSIHSSKQSIIRHTITDFISEYLIDKDNNLKITDYPECVEDIKYLQTISDDKIIDSIRQNIVTCLTDVD